MKRIITNEIDQNKRVNNKVFISQNKRFSHMCSLCSTFNPQLIDDQIQMMSIQFKNSELKTSNKKSLRNHIKDSKINEHKQHNRFLINSLQKQSNSIKYKVDKLQNKIITNTNEQMNRTELISSTIYNESLKQSSLKNNEHMQLNKNSIRLQQNNKHHNILRFNYYSIIKQNQFKPIRQNKIPNLNVQMQQISTVISPPLLARNSNFVHNQNQIFLNINNFVQNNKQTSLNKQKQKYEQNQLNKPNNKTEQILKNLENESVNRFSYQIAQKHKFNLFKIKKTISLRDQDQQEQVQEISQVIYGFRKTHYLQNIQEDMQQSTLTKFLQK